MPKRKSRAALPAALVAPFGSVKDIDAFIVSPTPSVVTALCGWLPSGALLLLVQNVQLRRELVPITFFSEPAATEKLPPSVPLTPTYTGESVGKLVLVRSASVNESFSKTAALELDAA